MHITLHIKLSKKYNKDSVQRAFFLSSYAQQYIFMGNMRRPYPSNMLKVITYFLP